MTRMISWLVTDVNQDAIFSQVARGKTQKIFKVWLVNQSAPSTLSTVLVYTKAGYPLAVLSHILRTRMA